MELGAVECQGSLLAHIFYGAEVAGEGSGDGVAFHVGEGAHEGLSVQAVGHGVGERCCVALPEGVAEGLGHDGGVADFAFATSVFVDGGVHSDVRLAARCEDDGGYEGQHAETNLFHNSGFLVGDK